MSNTGILFVVLMFWVGLALVIYPFVQVRRHDDAESRKSQRRDHQLDRLQALYEQCVASLRDLDEDYSAGRLTEAEYHTERELWSRRGVQALQVIRNLEQGIEPTVQAPDADTAMDGELDHVVEEAIAGYH